jgi:hypothetical protein
VTQIWGLRVRSLYSSNLKSRKDFFPDSRVPRSFSRKFHGYLDSVHGHIAEVLQPDRAEALDAAGSTGGRSTEGSLQDMEGVLFLCRLSREGKDRQEQDQDQGDVHSTHGRTS